MKYFELEVDSRGMTDEDRKILMEKINERRKKQSETLKKLYEDFLNNKL